jgi:hypothetical protein
MIHATRPNGMLLRKLKKFGMKLLKGFFAPKIQGIRTFTTFSN